MRRTRDLDTCPEPERYEQDEGRRYFFDLSLWETMISLFIIGLIQRIVALFIVIAIVRAVGVVPP